jgi:hypothetical protein
MYRDSRGMSEPILYRKILYQSHFHRGISRGSYIPECVREFETIKVHPEDSKRNLLLVFFSTNIFHKLALSIKINIMKEKLKELFKKTLGKKEIPGEPIDLTPGIKVSRVVNVNGDLSFNEIAQNILKQRQSLKN